VAVRERIARVLAGAGILDAALRLRAAARVPYLTTITYHHLADPGAEYDFDPGVADVTPAQFGRHLDLLARHFHVVSIDEVVAAFDGADLPPNPALITFDDGYRSCLEVAAPALAERGMSAVFFVPTTIVEERTLFWWERIAWLLVQARRRGVGPLTLAYPTPRTVDPADPGAHAVLVKVVKNTRGLDLDRFLGELTAACRVDWSRDLERQLADGLLMTWAQIRELDAAGMDIESHCRRHRVLQTLEPAELRDELAGSRADIERRVGRAPQAIAYPVGRPIAGDRVIRDEVARAGYRLGFTNVGHATWLRRGVDPLDLGRLAMDRDVGDAYFVGKLAIPQLAPRWRPPSTGTEAT
jgi:peptidoglycan/xylan/chitin deacetylase (PgdA/CDA1 family)